jgi:hypothetical protein
LETLPGWAWDAREAGWDEGFSYLERFVARTGDARGTGEHREEGFPLGKWVKNQRSFYRASSLSADRIARLEALPGWTWDAQATKWEEGFSHLEQFVARVGNARAPWQHRDDDDYPLGQWVAKQRVLYRTGSLSADRIARLEALPGWTWDAQEKT